MTKSEKKSPVEEEDDSWKVNVRSFLIRLFSLEEDHKIYSLPEMRIFVCFFILIVGLLKAAEVSTTPPDWYEEVLGSRMTPLDQVNSKPAEALIKDEPGVIILSESVYRIRPNGAKDVLIHYIYRPLTEKGVEQVQEERISFSAERQKVHLIKARTISPDGKITEAAPDGIFLQRPEGDSGSSIYDDREDLVVIYSDVKVGCMVEIVVLREELEPRVEGDASGAISWGSGGWPVVERRRVVGVGPEMNKRLNIVSIGKGVPTAKVSQEKDLTWYDWRDLSAKSTPYEVNRDPSVQVGPVTWYTTFQSWEQVGKWYGNLVEPQGLMESSLRSEVEKAVGDLTKPREVLKALYPLAAKEVRYTGLEFGHLGILPYTCNEVWNRKYGDCKDKSTLLVSMLRSRGIDAWVGLVNTRNAGLIPMKAPGTRMFNHAIAIVDVDPSEKEELVFCDPTISYGAPGVISPSTADREVLLASINGGRLVRSPKIKAGSYEYDFELEMDGASRLSGWMNWRSSGYYAVSTVSSYDGMDRESMRSRLSREVSSFFPSAEVVDFEMPDQLVPGMSECLIRVFFTTAPSEAAAGANIPLNFPTSGNLFMNYGDQKTRESRYFQWQDAISVTMSLKVAEGLVPVVLHPPLHALSPGYHIDAEWSFKPTLIETSLKVECLKSSLEPDEVVAAQQASRAWSQWVSQPLLLKTGKDWKVPVPDPEIKLPLMPTGLGQLALVQRWYPLGRESKRRELALQKVIQLFPNDPETLYEARLGLAYIHYFAGRMDEAAVSYEKLTLNRPAEVSGNSFSLAHYMFALCADEKKDFQKAAKSFEKSVAVEGVSDYRRGWGLTGQAQSLLKLGKVDEALPLFLEAEKIESNHRGEMLRDLIHCYLKKDQTDEAVAAWVRLETALAEESLTVLESLVSGPSDPNLASNDQLKKFFDALKPKLNPEKVETLDEIVSNFRYEREKLKFAVELRKKLSALLEEKAPEYLSKDLHLGIADQETYQTKLDEFRATSAANWLDHAYGYLARFEADDAFTTYFWLFIMHVEWKESQLPKSQQVLIKSLIPLVDLIPHQDDNYWESQFIVAGHYESRGDWKKAEEIYRAMPEDPLFDQDFSASAWQRRGFVLEQLGQWEEAAKVHLHLKDDRMEFGSVCAQVMRAGWIQARLGKPEEALETWSLLKEVPRSLYESLDDSDLIEEAVLLASMPEKTKSYWKKTSKWWDETLQGYLKENGLEIPAEPLLSDHSRELVINDLATKKPEDRDLEDLNELMTVILSGARWFPSFNTRIQDLFESFVRPITKATNEDFRRVAMSLLETVETGSEEDQISAAGQGLFFKVVLNEEDALEYGYKLIKRLNDEKFDGAKEIALRRVALVAIREEKDLEKVGKLLQEAWQLRGEKNGRVDLGLAFSQVLEARGLTREAIDFTKKLLTNPMIQEDPDLVKGVRKFLEKLEGESLEKLAFIDQIEAFQKKDPLPWLPHVAPNDLDEEGFEDPEDFLAGTGDERHPAENYKWGYLLLKSDLITREQRVLVFKELLDDHIARSLKNSQVKAIFDEVFENDRLSELMRRQLFWAYAVDTSLVQGDEKLIEELSRHPLAEGLVEGLKERGFQDLLSVARAKNGGAKEVMAELKAIVGRGEMGPVSSGSIENLVALAPALLDPKLNAEVESFLKTITLSDRTSRQMRQEVIRFRKRAADIYEELQFIPILKGAFQERFVELAKHAPADWQDYREYDGHLPLDQKSEVGAFAKVILEGSPQISTQLSVWQGVIPSLFIKNGETLDDEALKLFISSLDEIESEDAVRQLMMAALWLSEYPNDVEKKVLEQFQVWLETKKDRDLEDLLSVRMFVTGATEPSEDDLIKLARKMGRLKNLSSFRSSGDLFLSFFDREEQAPLEALLESLPEDALFRAPFSIFAIQSYRQLGEEDEVEILEEELADEMAQAWKNAWADGSVFQYQTAVSSYWLLGKRGDAPIPVWMKEIPRIMPKKVERIRCEFLLLMTQGKWQEFEDLLKENRGLLEESEGRVLQACADIGLKREGAHEKGMKVLLSPDKRDSYTFQLRQLLSK